MLAASALMIGWRYLYPLPIDDSKSENNLDPASQSQLLEADAIASEQISRLEAQFGALDRKLEDFARSVASSSVSQDNRQGLFKETLSAVSDRLSKIETVLRPKEKGLLAQTYLMGTDGTRLGGIEARLEELRTIIEKRLDALDSRLDDQRNNHHQLHDKVWRTFRAKQVLERITALMDKLEILGTALNAPVTDKESALNWNEWDRQFKMWEVSLHEVCTLIKPYLDVETSLLNTPAEKYKSQHWSMTFDDRRFPNPDRVHDYKTFRILFANLEEHKRDIMDAVRYEAFV
jgi:hypothetical protein